MYKDKPPIEEVYNELYHYGTPRHSGRYPWGSGKDPYQHSSDFLARVKELRSEKFTYTDENGKEWSGDNAIAKSMGLTTTQFRTQLSLAKDERRALDVATAKSLREDGLSTNKIAEKMGIAESSVRSLLNPTSEFRMQQAKNAAEQLKKEVDKKGMVDVGAGVAASIGISEEKMKQALYILEMEGYNVYGGRVPQATNKGQMTTLKVLTTPDKEHKEIFDYDNIKSVKDYISKDGGETFEKKFTYPASMDSKRLKIRYGDEGGIEKDGIVELRRGVQDLSLGESRYSQVRILVDGTHYIKGMAVYSDNMPKGVDVIFNTNKKSGTAMTDVLKKIKDDPDNPFGSAIKDADQGGQYWYVDKKTGEKKLGLINKRADEGDWSDWKNKVPSQFLSKQPIALAKKQLGLAIDDKLSEYNEICSLTNPTVKKRLLQSFSDDCDSAAVHLFAAALPRQQYHVIIPITSLKDNEVYAPNYKDGEQVALIRYPHGGTFEIPVLKVNNKHKVAKELLGNVQDAIGINAKVAERLSGADFDGDTVMVIPTNDKVKIKSTPQLEGLKGFDPKTEYGTIKKKNPDYTGKKDEEEYFYYNKNGHKIKVMGNTQNEMGRISNLITDMTLKGATEDELAKDVRHSMVVIDAEKHKLDYKSSYVDNSIALLKKKYQGSYDENGKYSEGASTLISRAKSQSSVDKRQGTPKINMKYNKDGTLNKDYDPSKPEGAYLYKTSENLYHPDRNSDKETGMVTIRTIDGKKITYNNNDAAAREKYTPIKVVNKDTGEVTFTNKAGDIQYKVKKSTQKSTKMADTDDAYTLVSDRNTAMEREYANYANKMKALANNARKEMMTTGKIEYSPSAAKTYKDEVKHIMDQLTEAKKNKPKERIAQTMANSVMKAKKEANPDMTNEEEKKYSQQELSKAREIVGAKRTTIKISDREWEAIQAGAISETKLKEVLNNTDIDEIRKKATPRSTATLSTAKINKAKAMAASGRTTQEIAQALGVSTTTVTKYLKGKE